MPLIAEQKNQIKDLLNKKIEKKLKTYSRQTTAMPFLARLIQDSEKIAAYSFIHSIATTLGMSIYEEVSVIIATKDSEECFRNYGVGGVISAKQKSQISNIVNQLRQSERKANIKSEISEILNASTENAKFQKSGNIADFYMKRNGTEYYFEIKTVKPNIDVFEKSKTKLLEWVARRRKDIKVFLAFPYNPNHPNPYGHFTISGMMDHPNDFLIGDEYWNLLGGEKTFSDLLGVFDEVGKSFKERLNTKFKEIARSKIDSY